LAGWPGGGLTATLKKHCSLPKMLMNCRGRDLGRRVGGRLQGGRSTTGIGSSPKMFRETIVA